MKKILSLVLTALLLAGMVPAMAQSPAEDAILLVKSRITIPESYTEFTYETYSNYDDIYYLLSWETPQDTETEGALRVEVHNNIIMGYSNYNYQEPASATLSSFTESEILQKAKEWMARLNPEIAHLYIPKISSVPNPLSTMISVRLTRHENGVPFPDNGGSLSFNKYTGELESFRLEHWEDATLPSTDEIMSLDEATAYFKEQYGLTPLYRIVYDGKTRYAKLVYLPDWQGMMLAKDGKPVVTEDTSLYLKGEMATDASGSNLLMGNAKPTLSEAEISALNQQANLLSFEEILTLLKKDPYFTTKGLTLSSSSLQADYYDKNAFRYQLYFENQDEEDYRSLSVSVNASTGSIESFHYYDNAEDNKTLIAKEKAEKKAKEVLRHYLGNLADEYRPESIDKDEGATPIHAKEEAAGYTIRFLRYANDIAVEGDYTTITITAKGVTGFNTTYTNIELPTPNILSEEEALEHLFRQTALALRYETIHYQERKTTLVYHLDRYIEIDAFTGNLLDVEEESLPYTDTDGHWCKDYAEALRQNGIRLKGKAFAPDATITKGEYLILLSQVMGMSYPEKEEEAIERLLHRGILEEKVDPSAFISRNDAVKYLIHVAGGKEFAKLQGIYTQPFSDVTKDVGYISLAYGMGIISGEENGIFRPEDTMTRGEASAILYRYLTR